MSLMSQGAQASNEIPRTEIKTVAESGEREDEPMLEGEELVAAAKEIFGHS